MSWTLSAITIAGCASQPTPYYRSAVEQSAASPRISNAAIASARGFSNGEEASEPIVAPISAGMGLPELTALALQRNPKLAELGWLVEAARGQAVQAGLYPNPSFVVTGDEISDTTGPGGIWSPMLNQEIVTANKLKLDQAVALKEVDQATLALVNQRYQLLASVRQSYYELIMLKRRVEILDELIQLAEKSVDNANKLLAAKEGSRLDVVQLEVDLERYRADREATQRAIPAAFRQLAATIGVQEMPEVPINGVLDLGLPNYDLEQLRIYVLGIHPEIRSAQIGVERAQIALKRATVEPIPNVTVGGGYTYQAQNRSNDWAVGMSLPIPVWNRNQGNILAAEARVGQALNQVARVQNDLINQLATAYGKYTAARKIVERYQTAILPKAQETLQLSMKAYQGGQFEYLRVLQAQRAVAEANLETVRALGEMWRAASEISGLILEDNWPFAPNTPQSVREDSGTSSNQR